MAGNENPCAKGLTPECFTAHPEWAKKAFAYRMFCMLAPPGITRRLQKYLVDAMAFPGTILPPGFEIPPGWTVPPGFVFPPGWKPGDPPPPGLIPPGVDWNDPPGIAPAPPPFICPWQPGPPIPSGGRLPTGKETLIVILGSTTDGELWCGKSTWSAARNATTSIYGNNTHTKSSTAIKAMFASGFYQIARSFLYFDLSLLPVGKKIVSAIVGIVGYDTANSDVSIQEGTQGSYVSTTNWSSFTGLPFAAATWRKFVSPDLNTNLLDFNAAGKLYVKSVLGGTAKFCLREYSHDYLDVAPAWPTWVNGMYFANTSAETFRPYISIIYK